MKGVLPWLIRWACRAGTRDFCPALAALVGPVQNTFFRIVQYFNSFFPIAHQAEQAVVLGHLIRPKGTVEITSKASRSRQNPER
jgi:hypothetical protein